MVAQVLEFHVLQLHVQLPVAHYKALVSQDVLRDDSLGGHRLVLLHHPLQVRLHLALISLQLEDLPLELPPLFPDALRKLLHHLCVTLSLPLRVFSGTGGSFAIYFWPIYKY